MKNLPSSSLKSKLAAINSRWKEYALAGCVCILFYIIMTNLGGIFSALGSFLKLFNSAFIGAVFAYIVNPVAVLLDTKLFRRIKKKSTRWAVSSSLALLVVLLLFSLLLFALIPQIFNNILPLFTNLDTYTTNLQEKILQLNLPFGKILSERLGSMTQENGLLSELGRLLIENREKILTATGNIGSSAVNWGIGIFIAIYFLMSKEAILSVFQKFLKLVLRSHSYVRTQLMLNKFNVIFSKYIICEIIDALIVGVANYLFMLILHIPDALFISTIAALTNLVPTFGPIVGAVISTFILLLVEPSGILPLLIFTAVIQLMDSYVIKPKLFGGVLNVPGVIILITVIVFGKMFGVIGMLIAIPAAAILVYFYSELLIPWLELRQDLQEYRKEVKDASDIDFSAP